MSIVARPRPLSWRTVAGREDAIAATLGALSIPVLLVGAWLALSWAPPDAVQGQDMRLLYVHVPTILIGYGAFTISMLASVMVLWKKDLMWDGLALAATEVGLLFTAVAVAVGSIWGKLTWGTYWNWDPRLTTTAVLVVVFAGYLLLRALTEEPWTRARISAVVAIIGFIDIPVVHFSVTWWRSLHQSCTLCSPLQDPTMDDRMELALLVNFVGFVLLFAFLLLKRLKLARLERFQRQVDWSAQPKAISELEPAHG